MNPKKRSEIFSLLKKLNPNAKTELLYNSPFQLLIAVILSAQATDISVNKATRKLFSVASSAKKLSKLSIKTIETYINTIGLYKTKAKNSFCTLCQWFINKKSSFDSSSYVPRGRRAQR